MISSEHFQGLSNGVENDQNTANLTHGDAPHKRHSSSSTNSNQSVDSQTIEYSQPKHLYNHHNGTETYAIKPTNPLFGVNAASNYSPTSIASLHDDAEKPYERINSLPNGIRKAPEGQDNAAIISEDLLDGRKDSVISEAGTATYTTDNNGKINVHVTVMINAGKYASYIHLLVINSHGRNTT